jgi:FixJ family two-component response regulator
LRWSTITEPQKKLTVLIVDDDVSVLRSLKRLVQALGFDVLAFEAPAALLKSEIPRTDACMILDVNLPEMDGVRVSEVLAERGYALPTILMTGWTDDPRTHRLIRRAQAVTTLYKPFSARLLLKALSTAFGGKIKYN